MRQCKDKGHISHPQEKPQSTSTGGRGGRGPRWVHCIGGVGGACQTWIIYTGSNSIFPTPDPRACENSRKYTTCTFSTARLSPQNSQAKIGGSRSASNRPSCGASFQECPYAWGRLSTLGPLGPATQPKKVCVHKNLCALVSLKGRVWATLKPETVTKKVRAHSPARVCAWAWPAAATKDVLTFAP